MGMNKDDCAPFFLLNLSEYDPYHLLPHVGQPMLL